jgi:hypothetical protein
MKTDIKLTKRCRDFIINNIHLVDFVSKKRIQGSHVVSDVKKTEEEVSTSRSVRGCMLMCWLEPISNAMLADISIRVVAVYHLG